MLTIYTMHVISLMTKCSNCIGKSENKRAFACTALYICMRNECIMSTEVGNKKISQNHRHRRGVLCDCVRS